VELRDIPISRIVVTEGFNPRGEVMEDDELQAMAATMRERGCLQPIRVRETEIGDFALIYGERRYRAGTLAALTTLPALVLPAGTSDDEEYLGLLTDAMIENELRSNLDPLQRARGYQAMLDSGLGIRAVAERLGGKTKRSTREKRIKEHLPILSLPEGLRTLVAEQVIPLLAVKTLVELAEIHEEFAHAALRAVTPDGDDSEPYTWQELIENPIDIAMNYMDELPAGVYSSRNSYPVDQFTLSEKAQKDLAAYTKPSVRAPSGRFADRRCWPTPTSWQRRRAWLPASRDRLRAGLRPAPRSPAPATADGAAPDTRTARYRRRLRRL
jgi:ParB/RepB/Spo0J family partition protein